MRTLLFTIAALWLAGSVLALAGNQLMAGMDHCSEMTASTSTEDASQTATSGKTGKGHECPEESCCEGACLCKATCGSSIAMVPDLLRQTGEILPMNVLPETVDLIAPFLARLLDPPPRS